MIKIPITVYSRDFSKTDVVIETKWHASDVFGAIRSFSNTKGVPPIVKIYGALFPGNRFRIIQKLNAWLCRLQITLYMQWMTKAFIMCIRDPSYFSVQNNRKYSYLILSCDHTILKDKKQYVLYKEYFAAGWVFAYDIDHNRTHVFKKQSEVDIIRKIPVIFSIQKNEKK